MNTAGCTAGWVNYANERSQAALERSSQDAYDVIRLTRSKAAVWTVTLVIYYTNIQKISSSRSCSRLYNRLQSVNGLTQQLAQNAQSLAQTAQCTGNVQHIGDPRVGRFIGPFCSDQSYSRSVANSTSILFSYGLCFLENVFYAQKNVPQSPLFAVHS